MTITQFFSERLGAPLKNAVWSWGAERPSTNQIFLRVWEDQISYVGGRGRVLVLDESNDPSLPGFRERRVHLEQLEQGTEGFAVLCTPRVETSEGAGREIGGYDPRTLLRLGKVTREGMKLYAEILVRVPSEAVCERPLKVRTWIFQSSPKKYDLRGLLVVHDTFQWLVKQHKTEISQGDLVYFWESGPTGGVLARGTVLTDPAELRFGPGREFIRQIEEFKEQDLRVVVKLEAALMEPISKADLQAYPETADLKLFAQSQGTNFPVTATQAARLADIFAGRKPQPPVELVLGSEDEALGPVERAAKYVEVLKRRRENALRVKQAHGYACQVCDTKLPIPGGYYAEAAHIQPVGRPHDGPDVTGNMLCLCPNCHILFDHGTIHVDNEGYVVGWTRKVRLRKSAGHDLRQECLDYHRTKIAASIGQMATAAGGPGSV